MDFFSSQDAAKRNTVRLIAFFVLAVISMVVLTNLLVMLALGFLNPQTLAGQQINWPVFFAVGCGVLAIVTLGSSYKVMQLSGGGDKIADQLGGELIAPDNGDVKKQRLLNIVEEMAIASGVPVPPVYLIPGGAINAFAAGHTYSDAVIGVSRGALEQLTRDELQGVIGHEFSHILNGDMRLNIRLMGILHGILVIGLIGYYLLRFTPRSRNSKGSGGFVLLGLGLVVIGYGGTFFGNLIKAAVNRQREYLADSAAVQFTRNPDGIGGALIRIGSTKEGSVLNTPGIAEISHSLFSQGFTSSLTTFFATHPPLGKRIQRILPSWDGQFKPLSVPSDNSTDHKATPTSKERIDKSRIGMMATGVAGAAVMSSTKVVGQIGNPTANHVNHARELIEAIPEDLKKSIHSSYGAQAVIYALLIDQDVADRKNQLHYLSSAVDTATYNEVMKQTPQTAALGASYRLPLVDLALPTLRQLSFNQYKAFKKNLLALIAADNKLHVFEWTLQRIVLHHLDGVFENNSGTTAKEPSIQRAKEAGTILISMFINNLKQKGIDKDEVRKAVLKEIQWIDTERLTGEKFSLRDLDAALNDLVGLKPRYKEILLNGCATVVLADKHVSTLETELLRAVASGLNCPMPILLR
jgi:Zn-dependent protease with chaperone function